MKRIYLALLTVIASLGLAGATTFAVWSDTVTVTNNIVQTGSADLQVSNVSGTVGPWNTSTAASSLSITNLIPGGTAGDGFSFALWNNSTAGVNFTTSARITAVTGLTTEDKSQLEIAVYESGETAATGSGWITLTDWESAVRSLDFTLTPGQVNAKDFRVSARLKSTATNEWQGKTVTITFTVTGTQP